MSQPRLKGGPRKAPVSSSTAALCLALSTHQERLPLQWHCCLGASLRWAGAVPPLNVGPNISDVELCRCSGEMTIGYMLPTLSFPVSLLSDHHSSLLYLCLMLFSSSVFYFPFLESHLH